MTIDKLHWQLTARDYLSAALMIHIFKGAAELNAISRKEKKTLLDVTIKAREALLWAT